jgi:hypothetical protein
MSAPSTGGIDSLDLPAPRTRGERRAIIAIPGPTWRQWFYYDFLKMWLGLACFIADVLVVVTWIRPLDIPAMTLSLVGAIYLEFLLFRYLWYRPTYAEDAGKPFRPSWTRLTKYGRWTPEAELAGTGRSAQLIQSDAPRPEEFL